MGRNRKTKAAHALSGTFEKHPERAKAYENEPKPKGPLGDPPECFSTAWNGAQLTAIWHELVTQAPPGVLTNSDRLHVETTCRLLLRIRKGEGKSGDFSRLKEYLGKMAMNPADRTKVQVGTGAPATVADDGEKNNAFEQLAGEDPIRPGSVN